METYEKKENAPAKFTAGLHNRIGNQSALLSGNTQFLGQNNFSNYTAVVQMDPSDNLKLVLGIIQDFSEGLSPSELYKRYSIWFTSQTTPEKREDAKKELDQIFSNPDYLDFSCFKPGFSEDDILQIQAAMRTCVGQLLLPPKLNDQLPSDRFAGLTPMSVPLDDLPAIRQSNKGWFRSRQEKALDDYHARSSQLKDPGSYTWRAQEYWLLKNLLTQSRPELSALINERMSAISGGDTQVYDAASEIVRFTALWDPYEKDPEIKHPKAVPVIFENNANLSDRISEEGEPNAGYARPDPLADRERALALKISTITAMFQKENFEKLRKYYSDRPDRSDPDDDVLISQILDEIESIQDMTRYTSTHGPGAIPDGDEHYHVAVKFPDPCATNIEEYELRGLMDFIHESTHAVVGHTFQTKIKLFAFPVDNLIAGGPDMERELNLILEERAQTMEKIQEEIALYAIDADAKKPSNRYSFTQTQLTRLKKIAFYPSDEWRKEGSRAYRAWLSFKDLEFQLPCQPDASTNSGAREVANDLDLYAAYELWKNMAYDRSLKSDRALKSDGPLPISNLLSEYDTVINETYVYFKRIGLDQPTPGQGYKQDPLFLIVEKAARDAWRYRDNYRKTGQLKSVTTLDEECRIEQELQPSLPKGLAKQWAKNVSALKISLESVLQQREDEDD